jgi:hypothetical protein
VFQRFYQVTAASLTRQGKGSMQYHLPFKNGEAIDPSAHLIAKSSRRFYHC